MLSYLFVRHSQEQKSMMKQYSVTRPHVGPAGGAGDRRKVSREPFRRGKRLHRVQILQPFPLTETTGTEATEEEPIDNAVSRFRRLIEGPERGF